MTDKCQEQERIGPEDVTKGIALHNPRRGQRKRSNSGLRKEAVMTARLASESRTPAKSGVLGRRESGTRIQSHIGRRADDRNGISAGK